MVDVKRTEMVAEAEVTFQQSLPAVLDIQLLRASAGVTDIDGVSLSAVKSPVSLSVSVSVKNWIYFSPVGLCGVCSVRGIEF